jgi:hypothetical protein
MAWAVNPPVSPPENEANTTIMTSTEGGLGTFSPNRSAAAMIPMVPAVIKGPNTTGRARCQRLRLGGVRADGGLVIEERRLQRGAVGSKTDKGLQARFQHCLHVPNRATFSARTSDLVVDLPFTPRQGLAGQLTLRWHQRQHEVPGAPTPRFAVQRQISTQLRIKAFWLLMRATATALKLQRKLALR